MSRVGILLVVAWVWAVTSAVQADDPKTVMTERGKLVFQDDFRSSMDKAWKKAKGKWEINDGSLRAAELPADMHGAAARVSILSNNAVFQYSIKFDGAKQSTLSLNASKGHLSRVVITPTMLAVKKDSLDHNKTDKAALLDQVKIDLKPGQWYTVVVELLDKEILASIDGKEIAYGKHEAINVAKANFGLTVAGESVSFKDFRLWEARPNPSWETTRQRFIDARVRK